MVLSVTVAVLVGTAGSASPSVRHQVPAVKRYTVVSPAYKPKDAVGLTDDYHCTLVNPHITQNAFVISSQFKPGGAEVHHAVLSLVAPSQLAAARQANAATGGKGWTCFGAPSLPNASLANFLTTPMLSVWAPGHGVDALPKGSGIALPAGSLVIEQVHYNLLVGDKAVRNSLVLDTVPASAPLLRLHSLYAVAPPDIPCPAGVTGPLCNRAASLADLGRRFGQDAIGMVNGIEAVCGNNPSDPPSGDSTSCKWTISSDGYIVRIQPHMHLLGQSFSEVLNPGTAQAKTVLSVPSYNFHYQKAYNLSTPIPVKKGDQVQVNCSYDPKLAQELPTLRKAPPHFVTFGDGSTDEMCVGVTWMSPSLPNAHSTI
jgi:hypothetical protein